MVRNTAFVLMLCLGTSLPGQTVATSEPVTFIGAAQPIARLKNARAIVFDAAGKPLFSGDEDYIRAYAHSPAGRVQLWDATAARIRLSSVTHEVWLNCADVEPMAIACTDITIATVNGGVQIRKAGTNPARGGFGSNPPNIPSSKAIPNCPASKLCPKL